MHQKPQLSAACAAFLVMLKVRELYLVTQQGTHRPSVLPSGCTQAHKSILADSRWACGRPSAAGRNPHRHTDLPVYIEVVS